MKIDKLLMTAPNLDLGGVASFVKSVLPYLSTNVELFRRGRVNSVGGKLGSLVQNIFSPIKFTVFCISNSSVDIIINTSLSKACLVRDGLQVFIAKLFKKNVLLIVHGFQQGALKHKFLLDYGYFRADSIVVLSKEFENSFRKQGYTKPIYTQFNPVDVGILSTSKPMRDYSEVNDILFISRLETKKGIYITLDFFKEINRLYPHIKLHVAGDGPEFANMKSYISDNSIDNVVVYGFVAGDEKAKLLYNADALIFPSYYAEGLPISVLEAMSAGQIILTRPVAGLVDLYDAIDFGASIDSRDSKNFVESFVRLIEDPKRLCAVREANYKFARENFHPQIVAQKLIDILNRE